jgi:hypothetical protein
LLCAFSALAVSEFSFGLGSIWVAAFTGLLYFALLLIFGVVSRNRVTGILQAIRDKRTGEDLQR